MKVTLIMADAVATHPDGTFSLLRGGITRVNIPKNHPIGFHGALLARINATPAEAGQHEFKLICVDQDGARVGQELAGNFALPPEGGQGNLAVVVHLGLPRLGKYSFLFSVDKHEYDSWLIEAVEIPTTQAQG